MTHTDHHHSHYHSHCHYYHFSSSIYGVDEGDVCFSVAAATHIYIVLLGLLLEGAIDQLHPLHDIEDGQLVLVLHVRATRVRVHLLRHGTSLILNEVESVHHELCCGFSVHADSEHADDARCEAVVEAERGAGPALHVERDRFEAAHVEEGLVLDGGEPGMVQEVAEHEASGLVLHAWHFLEASSIDIILTVNCILIGIRLLHILIIPVFLVRYGVLSRLLIKLALHENVEEHGDRRHVRELAVDIDRPEEGV